jgi:predicted permease
MFNPKVGFNALSSIFKDREVASEIDSELQFHLETMVEEYIASGVPADQAREIALKRFGDINQVNYICQEIRATEAKAWLQDLSQAFKTLSANSRYSILSVFTLYIGLTTTIIVFSIANTLLWRPIPYRAPDQLIVIQETNAFGEHVDTSNPNFLDLRDKNSSFEHLTAYSGGVATITGVPEPERGYVAYVARDFFSVLGVEPFAGRLLLQDDHAIDAVPMAVVSYSFWQRQLGSESDIKNKQVSIAGRSFSIAGVMPSGVDYPVEADVWIPRELFNDDSTRSAHNLKILARLKNNTNLSQARTDLSNLSRQLEKEYPDSNAGQSFTVISLYEQLTATARLSLLGLSVVVGFVLFTACANVSNLLLIRDSSRQRMIVSRLRLGASRFRIARQLIIESTLLALIGSLLGLALSSVMDDLLLAFIPNNVPGASEARISGEVLCFTVGITILVGLIIGLIPALRISQIGRNETFTENFRERKFYSLPVSEVIVIAQLALSVILIATTWIITQNFWYLSRIDPGFNPQSVLTAQVSLPQSKYQEVSSKIDFYHQTLERIRLLPGVKSAGVINNLPFSGQNINGTFYIEQHSQQKHYAGFRIISPGYFQSLVIPLLKGRLFNEQDDEDSVPVTIISRNLASQIWADQDPIGKRIRFIGMDQESGVWMTVVGVIGDVKHSSLNSPSWVEVYVPYTQRPFRIKDMTIVIRTDDKPEDMIDRVRGEIHSVDKNLPVQFESMREVLSKTLATKRNRSIVLILFAFTTVVLTLSGFYIIMKHENGRHLSKVQHVNSIPQLNYIYNSVRKGIFLSTGGFIVGLIAFGIILRIKPYFFSGIEVSNLNPFAAAGIIIFIPVLFISCVTGYNARRFNPPSKPIKEGQ